MKRTKYLPSKIWLRGFSLVELALVFVIIAFLIVAIAAGNSLIRQSKLNNLISDFTNYHIIYNNFKNRYHAVPGDMKNASAYWSNCANTNAYCNGDGNGIIDFNNNNANLGDGTGDEPVRVWRHLYLAGFIDNDGGTASLIDNYSAFGTRTTPWFPTCTGLADCYFEMAGPSTTWAGVIYGYLGGPIIYYSPWINENRNASFVLSSDNNGVLTPDNAFNIDSKIDDGNAEGGVFTGGITGVFRALNDQSGSSCLDGSNNYDTTQALSTCIVGSQLD